LTLLGIGRLIGAYWEAPMTLTISPRKAALLLATTGLMLGVPINAQPVAPGDEQTMSADDESEAGQEDEVAGEPDEGDPVIIVDDDPDNDFGERPVAYTADPIKNPGEMPTVERPAPPANSEPAAPPVMVQRSSGGRRVLDREVRWQAQLYQVHSEQEYRANPRTAGQLAEGRPLWSLQHLCGGSLISLQNGQGWVVSAAHCLAEGDANKMYRVRLGSENFQRDNGWTYKIDRVVRHPGFPFPKGSDPSLRYDIELIHFSRDKDSSPGDPPTSQVIPINRDREAPPPDGVSVYATGWGILKGNGTAADNGTAIMMKVQLNNVVAGRCMSLWKLKPNDTVVCAGDVKGNQTCQGDSGGPLVNAEGPPRLIGVVSWNNEDCIGDVKKPGVYTRVAEYSRWIDGIAGER
jgi:Trypsin